MRLPPSCFTVGVVFSVGSVSAKHSALCEGQKVTFLLSLDHRNFFYMLAGSPTFLSAKYKQDFKPCKLWLSCENLFFIWAVDLPSSFRVILGLLVDWGLWNSEVYIIQKVTEYWSLWEYYIYGILKCTEY